MIRSILIALALFICGTGAANAVPSCTPSSSGVAFGTFTGSQINIVGTITIECTGTGKSPYTLQLSTGSSGAFSARQMKNGSNSLSYNLYRDAAYSQIWGNGTGGSQNVTGNIDMKGATTLTINVSIYAKLPTQTKPVSGAYTDTIVATLTLGRVVTTTSVLVTANVLPDCSFSATNLVFGTYTGTQLDGQSQITLTCNSGVAWNVGLSAGTFSGATVTSRKMAGPGTSSLAYSLYRDASRTLNWGNTVGTDTVAGTGTGSSQSIIVYGRVPPSQTLPTGGYQDTIIATITF